MSPLRVIDCHLPILLAIIVQCLKESYVKMIGVGVGLSLDRLTCQISSPLTSSLIVDDTKMWIDGQLDADTYLEELLLDGNYAVSVALKRVSSRTSCIL